MQVVDSARRQLWHECVCWLKIIAAETSRTHSSRAELRARQRSRCGHIALSEPKAQWAKRAANQKAAAAWTRSAPGGRALQGLVGSGHDITRWRCHIKTTDANRGHLAALLGGTKNVMVAGHDLQGLRAAVDDPDIDFHGGGGGGGVAGPPSILVPPPPAPSATDTNLPPPSIKTMKGPYFSRVYPPRASSRGGHRGALCAGRGRAWLMARLAHGGCAPRERRQKDQLKKRRHIAESSDDDDDAPTKPLTVEETKALADSLVSLPRGQGRRPRYTNPRGIWRGPIWRY